MRFLSRLGKDRDGTAKGRESVPQNGALHYDSVVVIDSKVAPGVKFAIHRVSFGRRMELSRRVREISRKAEFLQASVADVPRAAPTPPNPPSARSVT